MDVRMRDQQFEPFVTTEIFLNTQSSTTSVLEQIFRPNLAIS